MSNTDGEDTQRIEKEAIAFADSIEVNSIATHTGLVKGYIAGATIWAEKLKQERNKVIDECIEILLDELEDTSNTREEMRQGSSTVKRMESIKDKDYV